MIEVFAALQNADLTEGRGPMVPKALFMGVGFGEVSGPMHVYESFNEWPDKHLPDLSERIRDRALAKLSVEERKALGL